MSLKMKDEKNGLGFNAEALLKRIALLACVSCFGCDWDGREIIRQIAEGDEDSGEDNRISKEEFPSPCGD